MKTSTLRNRLLPAVALAAMTGLQTAQAAAIDVADVVTDITAQLAPIALIGGAVLLVFVAIKAFKWVRRAM